MYITIPLSWPIGKLLDKVMGEHELQRYNNDELKQLILLHTKKALEDLDSDHVPDDVEGLEDYNAQLISGALEFSKKNVKEVMTEFKQVECL
jgi:CBS domain containing-hemolysin-like protein